MVSLEEFENGIIKTKINYKTITGFEDLEDLYDLFDDDGSGEVSLVEFLGFPDVEGEAPHKEEDVNTMWKRYVNNSKLLPMTMTRQAKWQSIPPLEYQFNIEHPEYELQKI